MIKEAIKLAKTNKQYHHKVGCVITNRKGHIISTGVNSRKTHPLQGKYAIKAGIEHKIHLHAEISALVTCKEEPHNIYIARITKGGNIGLSKPCPVCFMAIKESNIKNIFYTEDDGTVIRVVLSKNNKNERKIHKIVF